MLLNEVLWLIVWSVTGQLPDTLPVTPSTTTPGGAIAAPSSVAAPATVPAITPPAAAEPNVAPAALPQSIGNLVPIQSRLPKAQAADLVDALFSWPEDLRGTSAPLTLLDVLGSLVDMRQQQQAVHAYWKLSAALAEWRLARDQRQRYEQMESVVAQWSRARGRSAAVLEYQTRLAAARAEQRDAELRFIAEQYALHDLLGASATRPLGWPIDRPHVGTYRTLFEQVYGTRPAPSQARLLDRVLPLRRDTIEIQAAAVQAATDVDTELLEALARGEHDPISVCRAHEELAAQWRKLATLVRDYNLDIASYALSIPGRPATVQETVGMLIRRPHAPTATLPIASGAAPSIVRPSTIVDPAVAPATYLQSVPTQPTPPAGPVPPQQGVPTLAPPRPGTPAAQEVRKAIIEHGGDALYRPLMTLAPQQRAAELANLLHFSGREMPMTSTRGITLGETLALVAEAQRGAVIETYWQLREQMGRYHIAIDKAAQFDALAPLVLAQADATTTSDSMLRLRTARLVAQGEVVQAQIALAGAQLQLAERTGLAADTRALLALTTPYAGAYRLSPESLAPALREQTLVQRLIASIPIEQLSLGERAAAVVLVDATRAEQTSLLAEHKVGLDAVLETIERQATESYAFLGELTRYNSDLARFALRVMPEGVPSDVLVKTLVVSE